MGRIRTIKPEFPQSESMGKLSWDDRLVFLLLFTIADDAGRTKGSTEYLTSYLFPYDKDVGDRTEDSLKALEDSGKIRRYKVNGNSYLDIPKWLEHQKINRPSYSRLPSFEDSLNEDSVSTHGGLSPRGRAHDPRSKILDPRSKVQDAREDFDYPIDAFEQWFDKYPHQIGIQAARKEFGFVRSRGKTSFKKLMDGIDNYVVTKPDDREWCNPAKWLKEGRWADRPAPPVKSNGKIGFGETAEIVINERREKRLGEQVDIDAPVQLALPPAKRI